MKKNFKKRMFFGLLFIIISLSVGYALIKSDLSIGGSIKVKSNSFAVQFENVNVKTGSVSASAPSVTDNTSISVSANLNKPGDFYEFTVDVANKGTIDAMINAISINTLTSDQQNYLDYKVTYDDGSAISKYDKLVSSTGKKTIKVSVLYKNVDVSSLPSSDDTININVSLEYVQADENAN